MNIQVEKIVYRSDLETIILASFPPKSLNYTVNNLYHQKRSTLTIAKLTTSTRSGIALQMSVSSLTAITMCCTFTLLIVGLTKAILNVLQTCYVQKQCVGAYFACIERLFTLSAEMIINVHKARPRFRCTKLLLRKKQVRFSGSVAL